MTASPQVRHRFIIRHPREAALLLLAPSGDARLPAISTEDRHTAEVDYLNAAVREELGLVTTVLRSLDHSGPGQQPVQRVHELEWHGGSLPAGGRWEDVTRLSTLSAEEAAAIRGWMAGQGHAGADGREWERPGWFAVARDWIEQALQAAGLQCHGVLQLRAWPSSTVLLAQTAAGDFYFKAVPQSLRHECAVTAFLAEAMPRCIAPVLALHPQRWWLLLQACPGKSLEDVSDPRQWERAASAYASLQVACINRIEELRACGCAERRLGALPGEVFGLCTDSAALRIGAPDGLSTGEHARLRSLAAALPQRCAALSAVGIPPTIEHGDLWPGNFLIDATHCAIIDWEEAAIGHPFLSLAPLMVGLGLYQPALAGPDVMHAIEHAYLEPFREVLLAERLTEALRLARPLSFLDMAVRYRRQPASMTQLHPWMRNLVPQAVRWALAQL